jgi:PAS domain S-box-containing protein
MRPESRIAELEGAVACLRRELIELRMGTHASDQDDLINRLLRDRTVLENLPDIVTVLDRDYRILYLNRTVPGWRVEDVLGTSALEHMPKDEHARWREMFEQAWQTGLASSFEFGTLSQHWWESHFVPVRVAGEVVCMLGTSVDVTQRRRAERALL